MNPFFNPLTRQMDVGPDAGENVSVTGNTVNFIGGGTGGVVYNAGAGLTLEGNVFTANVAAVGFGMELSGGTASYARYRAIETISGSSVTLQAGHAYKAYATAAAVTLNTETIPAGQYGQEGHLEIFVAGTGYVVTGSNVVLANALEPDAVNNCTVRFHDGLAIISVEDHVAGYIVTVNAASGAGSLAYGLSTATNEYISVDASLNGQALDLAGATTYAGEKHVVGNGYTETIVSGGINCTSKTTLSNLAANGVVVSSGTLTLGDVYIPNGATVSVSGGGLAIEKVTGDGGTIDLNGASINYTSGTSGYANGCTFTNGARAFNVTLARLELTDCTLTGNTASYAAVLINENTQDVYLSNCVFSGNTATSNPGLIVGLTNGAVTINGCDFDSQQNIVFLTSSTRNRVFIAGSNSLKNSISPRTASFVGAVSIASGAIVDLTGNSYATPIAPGSGGVTFAPGGATVYPSAGQASAYMLGGMTVPQLGNTNVVNLNGSSVVISSGTTASASGCTFSGGSAINGGAVYQASANVTLVSCVVTSNIANAGGGICVQYSGEYHLSETTVSGNTAVRAGDVFINSGSVTLHGGCVIGYVGMANNGALIFDGTNSIETCEGVYSGSGVVTISSGATINLTSSINPGGTGGITVLTGGCTVNGNAIAAGSYTSIDSTGTPT